MGVDQMAAAVHQMAAVVTPVVDQMAVVMAVVHQMTAVVMVAVLPSEKNSLLVVIYVHSYGQKLVKMCLYLENLQEADKF